jgi:hypothetical protein
MNEDEREELVWRRIADKVAENADRQIKTRYFWAALLFAIISWFGGATLITSIVQLRVQDKIEPTQMAVAQAKFLSDQLSASVNETQKTLNEAQKTATKLNDSLNEINKKQEETAKNENRLQKQLDEMRSDAELTKQLIKQQVDTLAEQHRRLAARVNVIEDAFCPGSSELRGDLRTQFNNFIKYLTYLEGVGFKRFEENPPSLCIFSDKNPATMLPVPMRTTKQVFYKPDDNTIYAHRELFSEPENVFPTYALYALTETANSAWEDTIGKNAELANGLAYYFSVSFLDAPEIRPVGSIMNLDKLRLRSLDNDAKYSEVDAPDHALVWGGALWQCRAQLGRDIVDKVALQAWTDTVKQSSGLDSLKAFGSLLGKWENSLHEGGPSCFVQQMTQRGLPRRER